MLTAALLLCTLFVNHHVCLFGNAEIMAASSRYIAIVTGLSFLCFVLCCVAVFLPYWGFFEDSNTSFGSDHGYFSPWKVCKELAYDRTKCGSAENGSRFRPSHFVLASGITIAVSTVVLALHFLLSVKQIYAVSSRDEDVAGYNSLVTQKLVLAVFGGDIYKRLRTHERNY